VAEPVDIFISYAREERPQARALRELLIARDQRVFLDAENIRPGQPWRQTIVEALQEAAAVCVLWSRAAHDPDRAFVREEAGIARSLGSYFPICLDDADVPFGFGEFHYADLVYWDGEPSDDRLPVIIDQLVRLAHERRDPPPAHSSNAEKRSQALSAGLVLSATEPVARTITIDAARHPLSDGSPPEWASAWGEDRRGVWVALTVDNVTQRLRWIPPGEFTMGSPKDEPGRFDDESPAHQVILTQGYWLFDTPCTQALWQAVMGENPSEFQSPEHPVEGVSWDDCLSFLNRINRRLTHLNLSLPTEAQWEYACRAGTNTATYAGAIELLGDANAPALDPISWYGGNSGVGFELENGVKAAQWLTDRQYRDDPSGTHPVKNKQPNPWGLYDMLGNVLEWCSDGRRDYTKEGVVDPRGSVTAGAERVVRGGSWDSDARYVRCACRIQDRPDDRVSFLGFRPARVQS